MIIVLGGQKGGTGKSTAACNIASILAIDHDILLVDADMQPTSSMWYAERKRSHPDKPKVNSVQKYGEIDDALLDLGSRYQHVIVDAAGHDSLELRASLTVCDILLMPFRPTQPDLDTLPYMSTLILSSKRVNHKLIPYAFINSAPTNPQSKSIVYANEAIAEYTEIKLLDTPICYRQIYCDSMSDGLGATEMPDSNNSAINAKNEMRNLVKELFSETV